MYYGHIYSITDIIYALLLELQYQEVKQSDYIRSLVDALEVDCSSSFISKRYNNIRLTSLTYVDIYTTRILLKRVRSFIFATLSPLFHSVSPPAMGPCCCLPQLLK